GANDLGTVFRITPDGTHSIQLSLTADMGTGTYLGDPAPIYIIQGKDGNFYGNTRAGGDNLVGTFFQLIPDHTSTTITWSNPHDISYGTALGPAQLNATASVPGTFTYSPGPGDVPSGGSQELTVTFTPNDPVTYATATATVTLNVTKVDQTITFDALPAR